VLLALLAVVVALVFYLQFGGTFPHWILALFSASGGNPESDEASMPEFRRSRRGMQLRGHRTARPMKHPLDTLADKLGAVRKEDVVAEGVSASARLLTDELDGMNRVRGLVSLDEFEEEPTAASKPRARSGKLYTGRNPAQAARVRKHLAMKPVEEKRVGEAESKVTEEEALGGVTFEADPVPSEQPVLRRRAQVFTPPEALLARAGASKYESNLVEHDLMDLPLLQRLCRAGRLSSALKDAGVVSVGIREAIVLEVEQSTSSTKTE
jgi:hypothetical protein